MTTKNFKSTFNNYFKNLKNVYNSILNHNPSTCFVNGWNKSIIVSKINDDEYEWQPTAQTETIDFEKIEKQIGFKLNNNIKDFFSTYSFANFGGTLEKNGFENIDISFHSVNFEKSATSCILQSHKDGSYYYQNAEILLLGDANINNCDGFYLFYNNKTDSLFAMDSTLYEESNHKQKRRIPLGKLLLVINKIVPSI